MNTNKDRFLIVLEGQFEQLFASPEYSRVASKFTPKEYAEKMVAGLLDGTADKDGQGVKNTCKALGRKNTYKAILEYLKG